LRPGRSSTVASAKRKPFDRRFLPEESRNCASRLVHEGVEIKRDVWRDVFKVSNGILTLPFEGLEKGAGFDLNELDE